MNETQLRAFVRGYWDKASGHIEALEGSDHKRDHIDPFKGCSQQQKDFLDELADYWYERGIKDFAEMVLGKIGEKE